MLQKHQPHRAAGVNESKMMVTPPARASHDLQQVCISILQLSDQLQRADDLEGRRVLLRCDLNVPTGEVTGAVTDCSRILASLPVIMLLLSKGAKVSVSQCLEFFQCTNVVPIHHPETGFVQFGPSKCCIDHPPRSSSSHGHCCSLS